MVTKTLADPLRRPAGAACGPAGCSARLHRVANRAHLTPWMPWAADEAPEGTLRFIRLTRRQLADNDGFQTAIVCDGRIVGAVGFHGVDWDHRSTSIGYWLDAGHQGRGIMTAAVRALVDHALRGWKLNRVEIRAAPDNRAAAPSRSAWDSARKACCGRRNEWATAISTPSCTRCSHRRGRHAVR